MISPLSTLLERASSALPPQRPARSAWSPLAPVVRQLRLNGYDIMGAVDWLIGEGEIRAADRAKAYRSLLALLKCHGNDAMPALTLAPRSAATRGSRNTRAVPADTRKCRRKGAMPGQLLKKGGAAVPDDGSKLAAHASSARPSACASTGTPQGRPGALRKAPAAAKART